MLTPDYRSFLQMSREATLVPVAKVLSADLFTPVSTFLSIAKDQKYAFLLESVEGGEKIGRYTFLGVQPRTVITARGKNLTVRSGTSVRQEQGDALTFLRDHLRQYRPAQMAGLPPFTSGCVGYFAYDMVRQFERLPERTNGRCRRARLHLHVLRPAAGLRSPAASALHHRRGRRALRIATQGLRSRARRYRSHRSQAAARSAFAASARLQHRREEVDQGPHQHLA